jgi:pilus assembly protein CpaF
LQYGELQPLIDDPQIEEIWLNAPNRIFVADRTGNRHLDLNLSAATIQAIVERMLRDSGRRIDRSMPFADATLPDGSRLHVVIPDVTKTHWSVNIRKFSQRIFSMDDLVYSGTLSKPQSQWLTAKVRAHKNVLVSGATQAGKTTLLCALLDTLDAAERIITIEETYEIKSRALDWVALQARQANLEGVGEIDLRKLIREALRMRPTRIIVGEVRQGEALDLLIALNSGIAGLGTIHANSAANAIDKLKLLPLLAGENIPAEFIERAVGYCIDVVVHCVFDPQRGRRVDQIVELSQVDGKTALSEVHFD